jgi:hypothetical protein
MHTPTFRKFFYSENQFVLLCHLTLYLAEIRQFKILSEHEYLIFNQ